MDERKKYEIDFSKPPSSNWSNISKISYLQRRVIVYSLMYYEYNESCVSDFRYDAIAQQLARMQKEVSEKELKKTTYYYAFYDFDGSTGFHLASRLKRKDKKYLGEIVSKVHTMWKKEHGNE